MASSGRKPRSYEAKLTTLAATITRLAPDVLAVQEVGQPEALQDLVDRLAGSWTVVLSEHPDPRGIRVGFLTTLAPVSTTQVSGFPAGLRPIQTATPRPTPARRWAAAVCSCG